MNDRDFKTTYAGVYAGEGYWIDADGNLKSIETMGETYRKNVINHLVRSLYSMGMKTVEKEKKWVTFSGKYARVIANKLEQLGCEVKQDGDLFSALVE